MREIKFRAWDERKEIMHYNFQFIVSGWENNDWIVFVSDQKPWTLEIGHEEIRLADPHFCQQLKIMQYTGLKDKNGKEIYEGDIVRLTWMAAPYQGCDDDERVPTEDVGIIEFSSACFHFRGKHLSVYTHFHYNGSDREVIGSIYENPELLEAK